jgi:hypothetical protein
VSAINSPLLDFPIKKAKGIVFNVCGGTDLTLQEVRSFSVLFSFSLTFFSAWSFKLCIQVYKRGLGEIGGGPYPARIWTTRSRCWLVSSLSPSFLFS